MYQTSLLCASVKRPKCPALFFFFFLIEEDGIFLIVETKRKGKVFVKAVYIWPLDANRCFLGLMYENKSRIKTTESREINPFYRVAWTTI